MAGIERMNCQGCGGIVEYYPGQGLFKCGICGSIYESLGAGQGEIRVVQLARREPGPAAASSPQTPPSQEYQQGPTPTPGYQGFQPQQDIYTQPQASSYQPSADAFPMVGPTGPSKAGEFLKFRSFLTPAIIQIVFWLGVIICVAGGIALMVISDGEGIAVLIGLLVMLIGPIWVRIFCELMILMFRIYDELKQINSSAWYASYYTSQLAAEEKDASVD